MGGRCVNHTCSEGVRGEEGEEGEGVREDKDHDTT